MKTNPAKTTAAWQLEAEVIPGLEDLGAAELQLRCLDVRRERPGVLRCRYEGSLRGLLGLRLVVALYVVRYFEVPRPKALLGQQHFAALLELIAAIKGLGEFRTLRISAAGEESAVISRLREELAARSSLTPVTEDGDLLLRLRRAGTGWEVVARITPRPLSARAWRVCTMPGAINATVAAAMIELAAPQPDDFVLNLACGSGTFMIERLAAPTTGITLGCDNSAEAIACARRNLAAAGLAGRARLIQADATRLPLPDDVAAVLVADLPFGHLVGSHTDNATLYPALLAEAARVAQPGARLALVSHEVRLLEKSIAASALWTVAASRRITLPFGSGGINPVVYLLRLA